MLTIFSTEQESLLNYKNNTNVHQKLTHQIFFVTKKYLFYINQTYEACKLIMYNCHQKPQLSTTNYITKAHHPLSFNK